MVYSNFKYNRAIYSSPTQSSVLPVHAHQKFHIFWKFWLVYLIFESIELIVIVYDFGCPFEKLCPHEMHWSVSLSLSLSLSSLALSQRGLNPHTFLPSHCIWSFTDSCWRFAVIRRVVFVFKNILIVLYCSALVRDIKHVMHAGNLRILTKEPNPYLHYNAFKKNAWTRLTRHSCHDTMRPQQMAHIRNINITTYT